MDLSFTVYRRVNQPVPEALKPQRDHGHRILIQIIMSHLHMRSFSLVIIISEVWSDSFWSNSVESLAS